MLVLIPSSIMIAAADPEATTDFGKYAQVGVNCSFQREPPQDVIAQENKECVPVIRHESQWTWIRSLCRCFYPRSASIYSASVLPETVYLPPQTPMNYGKKTLVLDLDETLVHSSFQGIADPDFVLPVEVNGVVYSVFVLKRPGVSEFIEQTALNFELVVFTASLSAYANAVIDQLDPDHHITHRLFREHCIQQADGYVKDLSRLGRDLQSVILIDVRNKQNSSLSGTLNPDNLILIKSFVEGKDDELEQLYPLLQELIDAEDVRRTLRPQKRSISQTVTVDLEEGRSECNSPRVKAHDY